MRIDFINIMFRPGPTLLDLRRMLPEVDELYPETPCDCPTCALKDFPLPVGYYGFEFAGVAMEFPTHHERLIIVGLHSKCILNVIEGTKTEITYNTGDVLDWAVREPIALLHNHPDDFPSVEGMMRNEPSDVDCDSARMINRVVRYTGLHPVTHVVVTRDSGYATFNGNGMIEQVKGGTPCSLSPNM